MKRLHGVCFFWAGWLSVPAGVGGFVVVVVSQVGPGGPPQIFQK